MSETLKGQLISRRTLLFVGVAGVLSLSPGVQAQRGNQTNEGQRLSSQETGESLHEEVIDVGDMVGAQAKFDETTRREGYSPDTFKNVLLHRSSVLIDSFNREHKKVQFMFDLDQYGKLAEQVEKLVVAGHLPSNTSVYEYLQLHINYANKLLQEHGIVDDLITQEPIYRVIGGYTQVQPGPTRAESPGPDADPYKYNLPYLREYTAYSISGATDKLRLSPSISAFIAAFSPDQFIDLENGEVIDPDLAIRILREIYGFSENSDRVSFTTNSSTLNQQMTIDDGDPLASYQMLVVQATDGNYIAAKGRPYLGYLGDGLPRVTGSNLDKVFFLNDAYPKEIHISLSTDDEPINPSRFAKVHTIRGGDDRVTANQDNGEIKSYGNRIYLLSQDLGQGEDEEITPDAIYIEVEGKDGNGIIPLPKTILNTIIYESLAQNSFDRTIFLDFKFLNGYTIEDLARASSLTVDLYDEKNVPRGRNVYLVAQVGARYVVVSDKYSDDLNNVFLPDIR